MREVGLARLLGIGDLFAREAVDRECSFHDVRTIPDTAFHIEPIRRIGDIECADAHDRMLSGFNARSLNIKYDHSDRIVTFMKK